jgi:methyl-accepting chemotaxis protein
MKLRIAHKLTLMIAAVLLLSVASITMISVWKSSDYITETAKTDLAHLTSMSRAMCKASSEVAQNTVRQNMKVAKRIFDDYGGTNVSVRNGEMYLGNSRSGSLINNNFQLVDQVKELTGGTCTIFLNEGSKAKRISTNVMNTDGTRAVGTYASQQVFDAVIGEGKSYYGRAWVVTDWYVTAYEPIKDTDNKVVGILFVGVKERAPSLRDAMLSAKVGKTGYIYAIDSKGIVQIHPAKEGADLSNYDFIKEMMAKGPKLGESEIGWITYPWQNKELGDTKPRDKIVAYAYFKDWDWIIGVGSYLDEFTAPVISLRNTMMIVGLFCLGLAIVLGVYASSMLSKPLNKLVNVSKSLAEGDASINIDINRTDEIGILADSFREVVVYLKDMAGVAERIEHNDLTVTAKPKSEKDILGNSFQSMVKNLRGIIHQLNENARELSSAATEIASSSEQMSKGANDQSSQVGQVSSAIEQMTATIIESSKNAGSATSAAKSAADTALVGGKIVNDTIQGMQKIAGVVRESAESITKLASSADQIGEIIGVIDDIADQTNLLALNAAIEAARAGEQGRGFAVVADEVRKLAERTGKATGEITNMIKGIQQQTEDAVNSMEAGIQEVDKGRDLADKAGTSLNEIVSMAQRVTEMIGQMATASDEQSSAAEQISKNIEHISSVTKETATGAQESAAAAEELNRQAESLKKTVEMFRV